jgi:SOS-response transcriptional repressor LexA
MSSRQQAILEFILTHKKDKGYSPTLREIGDGVGLQSASSVHRYLEMMEGKGLIKRLYGSARTIEIVAELPSEVQIIKIHKEIPTVIQWQGRRYVYDPG